MGSKEATELFRKYKDKDTFVSAIYASGDVDKAVQRYIKSYSFDDDRLSMLLDVAQEKTSPRALVNSIVYNLSQDEKTTMFMKKYYEELVKLALGSSTPRMAEALENVNKIEGFSLTQLWHGNHENYNSETDIDPDFSDNAEQEKHLKLNLTNVEKQYTKMVVLKNLEKNKGREEETLRNIVRSKSFKDKDADAIVEIARDTNDPELAELAIRTIATEPKTKSIMEDKNLNKIVELAVNSGSESLAQAIDKVNPLANATQAVRTKKKPVERAPSFITL